METTDCSLSSGIFNLTHQVHNTNYAEAKKKKKILSIELQHRMTNTQS